jgi:hypothetical protein
MSLVFSYVCLFRIHSLLRVWCIAKVLNWSCDIFHACSYVFWLSWEVEIFPVGIGDFLRAADIPQLANDFSSVEAASGELNYTCCTLSG